LLNAEDAKLERLKCAILFTIVDVFYVQYKTNACYHRIRKIRNKNFIHSSSHEFLLWWHDT